MTTDLTTSGGSTTSESRVTMVAHQKPKTARAALAEVIIEISKEYELKFPEGSQGHQVENIIDFILRQYKTVSPNQVKQAVELNAAQKYHDHVESYGRLSLDFIGGCLKRFVGWRAEQRQRGSLGSNPGEIQINVRAELWRDWDRIIKKPELPVTQYIEEKWNHLSKHGKGFDPSIDKKKLKQYTKKNMDRIKSRDNAFLEAMDNMTSSANIEGRAELWALQEYKADKIRDYLLTIKTRKS